MERKVAPDAANGLRLVCVRDFERDYLRALEGSAKEKNKSGTSYVLSETPQGNRTAMMAFSFD